MDYEQLIMQAMAPPDQNAARMAALRNQQTLGSLAQIADMRGLQRAGESVRRQATADLRREGPMTPREQIPALSALHSSQQAQKRHEETLAQQRLLQQQRLAAPTAFARMLMDAGVDPKSERGQQLMEMKLQEQTQNINMGSIPGGSERVKTPEGQTIIRPQVGSKDYVKAKQDLASLRQGSGSVVRMMDLIEEHGTEVFGEKSGEMGNLYGDIVSVVAKAREMGVLQDGERKALEATLSDPSSFSSLFTTNKSALAQYKQLLGQIEQRIAAKEATFNEWGYPIPGGAYSPFNPGGGGQAPPGDDGVIDLTEQYRQGRNTRRSNTNR